MDTEGETWNDTASEIATETRQRYDSLRAAAAKETLKKGRAPEAWRSTKDVAYESVQRGKVCYVTDELFLYQQRDWARAWEYGAKFRTYITDEKALVKRSQKFTDHWEDESKFRHFLDECRGFGCPRPSSYPDVFHAMFDPGRSLDSVNRTLAPAAFYGWQEALRHGHNRGRWYRYDINSAYLWASTQGLPYPDSLRFSLNPEGNLPGIYRLELSEPNEKAPYPFNSQPDVIATSHEIDTYGLRVNRVIAGWTWADCYPSDTITTVVGRLSFAKQVSKAFWGRWAGLGSVVCRTRGGAMWRLPNPKRNLIWAHLIVSRVKNRLYDHAGAACHVYIDSIIVPYEIPTSTLLGDWKLEKCYPDGVYVHRTGAYGTGPEMLDTCTGQVKLSTAARQRLATDRKFGLGTLSGVRVYRLREG